MVDKPLEDTNMNKQTLVYKILGWYPTRLVVEHLVWDWNYHGPKDTKCRSSRNSFCFLKHVQKMLISQLCSFKLFARSGTICLRHSHFIPYRALSFSHNWHQSGTKARGWHKLCITALADLTEVWSFAHAWSDETCTAAKSSCAQIWCTDQSLMKTRACQCQKVDEKLVERLCLLLQHRGLGVRSKRRHHMVGLTSVQIISVPSPQLSTVATCYTNSKESIFAGQGPMLCSCIQPGSRVMQNSSVSRAEQTTLPKIKESAGNRDLIIKQLLLM